MDIHVFERLAHELDRWATDFDQEEYRKKRVHLLVQLLQRERLSRSLMHIRLRVDRVLPLGEDLEVWLLDFWLLSPRPSCELSHALQVLVVPKGLKNLPLPRGKYSSSPVYDDRNRKIYWTFPEAEVPIAGLVRFQALAPDEVPHFQGRASSGRLPWNVKSIVRLAPRPGIRDLLAQLLLLGIRQGASDMRLHRWLVEYGERSVPTGIHEFIPAAVDHAVMHYVVPLGSLRRYLAKVARGMAQMVNPSNNILEEASRLQLSPRTLYRWRSLHSNSRNRDDTLLRCEERATQFKEKRQRIELAHLLAQREQTTYDVVRKRIKRRLARGQTLQDIAQELLGGLTGSKNSTMI